MPTAQFIFGIHNHQPVGNFDHVFQTACDRSYKPFLETLENHPAIRLFLHISGSLIDWLEENEPKYIDRIAQLAQNGQLELISGGYYEPVLAAIPDHDKIGQIRKLNDYIETRFGQKPKGLWLTERVWEPHLAKPINQAGIKYIAVDDYHFLASGFSPDLLHGYFMTEEQNYELGLYPISQALRYSMPFKEPEDTIEYIRRFAEKSPGATIVMADDGEKFGLWPGSYERCYGRDNWLERFFIALESNSDWLKMTTPNEDFESKPPVGRAYLPTLSYFEMGQWSLPSEMGLKFEDVVHDLKADSKIDAVRPFLRGGTWRNFLAKYPESNWMQKRAFQISQKIESASENGDSHLVAAARDALWKGECNCAYWHGIFGGLYLPHLRDGIWKNLLAAENIVDGINPTESGLSLDVDLDGHQELEFHTPDLKAVITPVGGAIRELDIRQANFNILNSMSRYSESYHNKIAGAVVGDVTQGSIHDSTFAKEPNLDRYLVPDKSQRHSLVDHFYDYGVTGDKLLYGQQADLGDLTNQVYSNHFHENTVTVEGNGVVDGVPVHISKKLEIQGNQISITVKLTNKGDHGLATVYAPEFNFALLGGHTHDRYYLINDQQPEEPYLDSVGSAENTSQVSLVSEWEGVRADLEFEQPTPIIYYPVLTVSLSEQGFEKVYQSSVVHPVFRIDLEPQGDFCTNIVLRAAVLK
ncbi:alpha-amylase/4-alpha-glucanotransferase domain-containing protein [Candidatus Neomarinimicrobiota bacterium]